MEDELKALLQRVGLGLEQILTRKRFLQWQTGDALRLNRAAAGWTRLIAPSSTSSTNTSPTSASQPPCTVTAPG